MNRLIIIGASGHGKVIADIALKNGYEDIAFLDDDVNKKECAGIPVIGRCHMYENYKNSDFIVAIGNSSIRENIQTELEDHECNVVSLVHPSAVISRRVEIMPGTVIMAGAIVNSDTYIGKGCIINTGASVDHDNRLDEYNHVSVGAHLSGTVHLNRHTWIGAGATVTNNIEICEKCVIGAGAVVVKNISNAGIYVGIPAHKISVRD